MAEYTLFLDESDIKGNLKCFCLCGCIIEKGHYHKIEQDMQQLKCTIFGNDLRDAMHEFDVKRKQKYPYTKLQDQAVNMRFWSGLRKIMMDNEFHIIGAAINKEKYKELYPKSGQINNPYYVVLQMVLENYVHFLGNRDSTGDIIAENRSDCSKLMSHFYSIMANGTLYINRKLIQKSICGFQFCSKKDNVYGLQLSDFLANPINRFCSELEPNENDLLDIIIDRLYDGGCGLKNRFGLRQLLCTNP
jgi:hypothetical protein